MTDHYAAPTNTVLDLLRFKWTKGIALTKVAVILLFLLGISTAGCNQAELTEPNDSLVPTMTPSETAQTSVAIATSGPTPQINNGERKNNAEAESNPMSPEEALLMAIKWARWPPVQRFGTLIGNPTDAAGSVMRYEEGYKYYTDDMSNLNLEGKDVVTWAVILEGEFDATCEEPGCGHIKGPWPDWPTKPKDEDWIQTVVLMNAETGELMARGMYHLGRLRSTDGLEDLKHYLPQLPADDPTPYATRPAHDGQPSTLAFPRHNAPLGTDRGEQYTAGELVLEEGCLRVEIPARGSSPRMSRLVIWPSSFTFEEESGSIRIIDGLGRTAARVGDHIRLSRAAVTYQQARDREFSAEGAGHCAQPSTWVGDEVTVFDPENEATELRLPDPDVVLIRQKTVMMTGRTSPTAAGTGELVLDGPCLRLKSEYSISTIIWPAGFTPHVQDGVVQVRNGAGQVMAQVGDEITGGGAYYERGHRECPGEVFRVYEIKVQPDVVQPDVDVHFPRQDEFLDARPKPVRLTGDLVMSGKCLKVENAVRVGTGSHSPGAMLPIWPGDFELRIEDGAAAIVDSAGRAVARVGDRVQFSAFGVPYDWALKHGGVDEITPFCGGPYWAVAADFRAAGTQ